MYFFIFWRNFVHFIIETEWLKLFCLMLLCRRELSLSFSISFLVFILLFHKQKAKNVIRIVCWKTTKNYRSLPPRSFPFVFFFWKSTEENAGNSISETMNFKNFLEDYAPCPPSLECLRRSTLQPFFKISCHAKATASPLRLEWRLGLMQ